MSKEEEPVFDRISRVLTDVDETLKLATEALIVVATEMYEARRDITKLLEQIKDSLGKIAKEPEKPWQPETPAAEEQETQPPVVMPSSRPPWMQKKGEE